MKKTRILPLSRIIYILSLFLVLSACSSGGGSGESRKDSDKDIQPEATVLVPDVAGKTQAEAESLINKAGLAVGDINLVLDNTVEAGYVISQNPAAEERVKKGSPVSIVVSLGRWADHTLTTHTGVYFEENVMGTSMPYILCHASHSEEIFDGLCFQMSSDVMERPNSEISWRSEFITAPEETTHQVDVEITEVVGRQGVVAGYIDGEIIMSRVSYEIIDGPYEGTSFSSGSWEIITDNYLYKGTISTVRDGNTLKEWGQVNGDIYGVYSSDLDADTDDSHISLHQIRNDYSPRELTIEWNTAFSENVSEELSTLEVRTGIQFTGTADSAAAYDSMVCTGDLIILPDFFTGAFLGTSVISSSGEQYSGRMLTHVSLTRPDTIVVPFIEGMSTASVAFILESLGLYPPVFHDDVTEFDEQDPDAIVRYILDSIIPVGYVLRQDPEPNTLISKNSSFDEITVSVRSGNWSCISAGESHSLGIKTVGESSGTLWAWGDNSKGQLGTGDGFNWLGPKEVKLEESGETRSAKAVAAGKKHSLAIDDEGSLWAWGDNSCGQLGIGSEVESEGMPCRVVVEADPSLTWIAISAGGNHSLAIDASGNLWAWGDNFKGQLGTGDKINSDIPQQIIAGSDIGWRVISAGYYFSIGIDNQGQMYAWGDNSRGQLGIGDINDREIPTPVNSENKWLVADCGYEHVIAVQDDDGTLWAWGNNKRSQLGTGDDLDRSYPKKIELGSEYEWTEPSQWLIPSAGGYHSLATYNDCRSLWTWGRNDSGQLGNRTTKISVKPGNI